MPTHDIIVRGGSAGALVGLKGTHTSAESASLLPVVLSKAGPLPAYTAIDGAPIRFGTIYVAPPGTRSAPEQLVPTAEKD